MFVLKHPIQFISTGDNYRSLSQQFRIGRSTVGKIIREVCLGIHLALKEEYGQICSSLLKKVFSGQRHQVKLKHVRINAGMSQ